MTYVELIIVLSIFSIIATVVIFNYKDFQAKVDIKNLSNDIALKFAQAQKDSTSGRIPSISVPDIENWKPSYGIYFDVDESNPTKVITEFIYFADLINGGVQNNIYDVAGGEFLETINITRGNFIQRIYFIESDQTADEAEVPSNTVNGDVYITYQRPGTIAEISCTSCPGDTIGLRIVVASPGGESSKIDIYESGRIKID